MYYQGPDVVRQLPFPRHLRFDLDFKIYGAIKQAVKEHKLLVHLMYNSDTFIVKIVFLGFQLGCQDGRFGRVYQTEGQIISYTCRHNCTIGTTADIS